MTSDQPRGFVVIVPGEGGTTDLAQDHMDRFGAYIASRAGWEAITGRYFNRFQPGREYLREHEDLAGFGIVTPAFYIKSRAEIDMACEPLLSIERPDGPGEAFFLYARAADHRRGLADLAGRGIAGTPLFEPDYVGAVVFRGALAPGRDFTPLPLPSYLGAARYVREHTQPEYDAALFTRKERAVLERDGELAGLAPVPFEGSGEPLPGPLVVSFAGRMSANARATLARVLIAMHQDEAGRKVIGDLRMTRFHEVDRAGLNRACALFDAAVKRAAAAGSK
ncbi:MAG: PhnD/SsuA/transferrin family substrate-binding protein [Planctomycetes bacterium]|nr:PhnD/SsuA/transferrin family substrate-binding protein [Planctomycetota bacterium]